VQSQNFDGGTGEKENPHVTADVPAETWIDNSENKLQLLLLQSTCFVYPRVFYQRVKF
jgi:hypothetical protein